MHDFLGYHLSRTEHWLDGHCDGRAVFTDDHSSILFVASIVLRTKNNRVAMAFKTRLIQQFSSKAVVSIYVQSLGISHFDSGRDGQSI